MVRFAADDDELFAEAPPVMASETEWPTYVKDPVLKLDKNGYPLEEDASDPVGENARRPSYLTVLSRIGGEGEGESLALPRQCVCVLDTAPH